MTRFDSRKATFDRKALLRYIDLQLHTLGLTGSSRATRDLDELASGLVARIRETSRLLADYRAPADRRIESFLRSHFADTELDSPLRLPALTLTLDRPGVARELSLPVNGEFFESEYVKSYRVRNGVLHNPRHDRRTTQGTFHVAEGGLPVPATKKAVPKHTFAKLFAHSLRPPKDLLLLPYNAASGSPAHAIVSLLLRPIVSPEVPRVSPEQSMEIRFFAPGGLVSNLDFVERIFGNAGDPYLPENDSALDVEHWTGHSGCVILAPHLSNLTKRELGLPRLADANARQIRDGMCWERDDELYNDGVPFKVTCRTEEGVMVTLIADNYFGYCKKEVKTQISYAANLLGNVEEEHAGGAVVYRSYNLGDQYTTDSVRYNGRTFADVVRDYGEWLDVRPEGYAVDRRFAELIYVPELTTFDLASQTASWSERGEHRSIPILPGKTYMSPAGYKVRMERHPEAPSWRLIGTIAEGVCFHKPCTVSGGGKSEISKPLADHMIYGPVFVADAEEDFALVQKIFDRDYSDRWRPERAPSYSGRRSRPILSRDRSLGSVIKLLTPSPVEYNPQYNAWLESIPNYIWALVFMIKRFWQPDWGSDWRSRFTVDTVNGFPGHQLKYRDRVLVGSYLRVGWNGNSWRTFKLRQDFSPATKIQTEDDISASITLPGSRFERLARDDARSGCLKFVTNCERFLFQRPDDAIHRGVDHQTERDLASRGNFLSNFEPLTPEDVRDMVHHAADLDRFSEPMRKFIEDAAREKTSYIVCSANPRLIDGEASKNPRYLQTRPDLADPLTSYIAAMGTRLFRAVPADAPVHVPVRIVIFGRRNNPPDPRARIRGLSVYNPIHYQELPELFMDFIASLTGKSPSTTGAGSEGALTKGPFNALRPVIDLNNALVSYILTGLHGFSTPAGFIGREGRVEHDLSLLIPELWCRLTPDERDPHYLIEHGYLEPMEDFEHEGELIRGSRLGFRITARFAREFFGRLFDNPSKVFDEAFLRPETQNLANWVDGIRHITEVQKAVALQYLDDDSVADAAPPLRALLEIMAGGESEGKSATDPAVRRLFTRESLLASDWYRARLEKKQSRDVALAERHVRSLEDFASQPNYADEAARLRISERLEAVRTRLRNLRSKEYLQSLEGTIGADLLGPYPTS